MNIQLKLTSIFLILTFVFTFISVIVKVFIFKNYRLSNISIFKTTYIYRDNFIIAFGLYLLSGFNIHLCLTYSLILMFDFFESFISLIFYKFNKKIKLYSILF